MNIDVDGLEGNDYTGKFVNATPEQRKEYPVWSFFKDLSADVLNASPFGVADNMIATWNQSSNAERTYNVLMTLTAPLSPLKPGEARPTSLKPVPGETINIRPVVNKATTETPVNSTGKQAVTANGSSAEAVKSNAANSTSIKTPSNPVNGQKGTSTNYRDVFFKANPKLKGEVIVHHAVEQQVLKRYPGVFTESEINSLQNLRGIPLDKNSDVHLSQIRKEWNEFYRNNPKATKQNILDKAADIDKMFGGQFNPTR